MIAIIVFFAALLPSAGAHPLQIEPCVMAIHPQKAFLAVSFTGNISDVRDGIGIPDTEQKDGDYSAAAVKAADAYLKQNLTLKIGTVPLVGAVTGLSYEKNDDRRKWKFNLAARYARTGAAAKDQKMTITSNLFANTTNPALIISIGGFQTTLTPGQTATIDPSDLAVSLWRNIRDFVSLGVMHIFTGPDHMLFILGLLMAANTLRGVIKTLTGFTVAHSITLALSALNVVVIPNDLCDIFIALSIVYIGVENIFVKSTKHRFWIASAFGLVHGFGFSDTLRQVGLPQEGLAWCLLSFNMGVEIAQVIICCIAFPLLMLWKRDVAKRDQYGGMDWPTVVRFASVFVVIMGGYWLIQRLTGT
jgi:hydrogenase/urease accessory protein HupE